MSLSWCNDGRLFIFHFHFSFRLRECISRRLLPLAERAQLARNKVKHRICQKECINSANFLHFRRWSSREIYHYTITQRYGYDQRKMNGNKSIKRNGGIIYTFFMWKYAIVVIFHLATYFDLVFIRQCVNIYSIFNRPEAVWFHSLSVCAVKLFWLQN